MNIFKLPLTNGLWRKHAVHLLLLCWGVGFAVGLCCINSGYEIYADIMRNAAAADASIVNLLLLGGLPLILSFVVFRLSAAPLILPIVFFKAFSYAFCSFGLIWSYGSAGWLVRMLLLFCDSIWVLALLYFWIRHISGSSNSMVSDLLGCIVAACFGVVVDYLYIVPLLRSVLL